MRPAHFLPSRFLGCVKQGDLGQKSILGLQGEESVLKANNECLELPTSIAYRGKGTMVGGGHGWGRRWGGRDGEKEKKEPSWPAGGTASQKKAVMDFRLDRVDLELGVLRHNLPQSWCRLVFENSFSASEL